MGEERRGQGKGRAGGGVRRVGEMEDGERGGGGLGREEGKQGEMKSSGEGKRRVGWERGERSMRSPPVSEGLGLAVAASSPETPGLV